MNPKQKDRHRYHQAQKQQVILFICPLCSTPQMAGDAPMSHLVQSYFGRAGIMNFMSRGSAAQDASQKSCGEQRQVLQFPVSQCTTLTSQRSLQMTGDGKPSSSSLEEPQASAPPAPAAPPQRADAAATTSSRLARVVRMSRGGTPWRNRIKTCRCMSRQST